MHQSFSPFRSSFAARLIRAIVLEEKLFYSAPRKKLQILRLLTAKKPRRADRTAVYLFRVALNLTRMGLRRGDGWHCIPAPKDDGQGRPSHDSG